MCLILSASLYEMYLASTLSVFMYDNKTAALSNMLHACHCNYFIFLFLAVSNIKKPESISSCHIEILSINSSKHIFVCHIGSTAV